MKQNKPIPVSNADESRTSRPSFKGLILSTMPHLRLFHDFSVAVESIINPVSALHHLDKMETDEDLRSNEYLNEFWLMLSSALEDISIQKMHIDWKGLENVKIDMDTSMKDEDKVYGVNELNTYGFFHKDTVYALFFGLGDGCALQLKNEVLRYNKKDLVITTGNTPHAGYRYNKTTDLSKYLRLFKWSYPFGLDKDVRINDSQEFVYS